MTDLAIRPVLRTEVDVELLEEAQRQIAASSPEAAINEALRRLVETERAKRRAARAALERMFLEGAFDFSQLDEADE